jgi:prepilin-type N-terminal cleavage/methylation domain-containing protein
MKLRPHTPKGFTLIELLTVIAIIGILAAILIPTIGAVRETAKNARCIGNLRSLGSAYLMASNDNRGRAIAPNALNENHANAAKRTPGVITNGNWEEALAAYAMKSTSSPDYDTIFRCPADRRKADGSGVGVAYGLNLGPTIRFTADAQAHFSLNLLKAPSQTIMAGDSGGTNGQNQRQFGQLNRAAYTDVGAAMRGMSFRHKASSNYTDNAFYTGADAYAAAGAGTGNFVFFDGSTKALKPHELTLEMLYPAN